jgi:dimethylargininase
VSPLSRRLAAAFATSAIVAAASYLVTTLLYFAANGSTAAALAQILLYFALPAVVLFVLMGVMLLLERGRRLWLLAVLTLVAVLLAVWVGTFLTLLLEGNAVTGALTEYVVGSALGFGLIFEVVAVLLVALAGRRLFGIILRPRRGQRVALVRMPAPSLADGQLTHQKRVPVDAELAVRQWRDYVAALDGAGWRVVQVDSADELPDSVFVEDMAVIIDGTAVLGYPGAESRRGELASVREVLRGRGYELKPITWPGTLDGGDVLQLGSTLYVGRGSRTNAEGIRQLREIAAPLGRTVVAVPLPKVLHLKTAVTALPDGTVLGFGKPAAESARLSGFFDRYLAVPEVEGAHVVVLSGDTVMIAASAPETAKLIADLGYRTVVVDVSEFEKLEGSVTCLSILLP